MSRRYDTQRFETLCLLEYDLLMSVSPQMIVKYQAQRLRYPYLKSGRNAAIRSSLAKILLLSLEYKKQSAPIMLCTAFPLPVNRANDSIDLVEEGSAKRR